ncbi:MAG: metal-sulfur cluster assembly factor [Anaerolineales bacterium]|jgi:metal-sulfur cluster biosynthetic enzyme
MISVNTNDLERAVQERLREVIDPETGADVVRMRLIENLTATADGKVKYTFHPSSPLCPIAVYLIKEIKQAVARVPGVRNQEIKVTGYIASSELTQLINKEI